MVQSDTADPLIFIHRRNIYVNTTQMVQADGKRNAYIQAVPPHIFVGFSNIENQKPIWRVFVFW